MSQQRSWQRYLVAVAIGLALVFVAVTAAALLTPVHQGPLSDHFDGKRFSNIPREATIDKSLFEILLWRAFREPGSWAERDDTVLYIPPRRSAQLQVTLVNHASTLIQTDGINIVTDPMWSERASPLRSAGPRRYREPGIRFSDLPAIDVVLISHNHYDHMDEDSIRRLTQSHNPLFLVPLGNTRYMREVGARRIVELDWWQSHRIGDVQIEAVPAQHWSRRGAFDTNRALWAGYVIGTSAGPVYFAGDTGMGPHFNEIGARYGALRLALLPIGDYLPRWFMAPQHISPEEAVIAHKLLGARQSMAIHFGTFQLGDDGQDEPISNLVLALQAADLPTETFWIPINGDSRIFVAEL